MARITHKNVLNCWEYFIKNNQFKANEVVGTEDKTKEQKMKGQMNNALIQNKIHELN